jgi:hypothetical protein
MPRAKKNGATIVVGAASGGVAPALMLEKRAVFPRLEERDLDDVKLDPDNPRIRHLVAARTAKTPPTDRELRDMILALDGVGGLQRSVRDNGGLQEPIYVLESGLVVEGNCRTAVYLKLREAAKGNGQWTKIPAYILPAGTNVRDVAILQAICHVVGKKRWDPYEKAGHVHRMRHEVGMSEEAIQEALGLNGQDVQTLLRSYETMNSFVLPALRARGARPADAVRKYSYVVELHKGTELAAFRKKTDNVKSFVDWITADPPKLTNGQQVRQLHKVLEHAGAKKALLARKGTFEAALKELDDPAVSSSAFRQIQRATRALKHMKQDELEKLRREASAQALLLQLNDALVNAARVAKISLPRRTSA